MAIDDNTSYELTGAQVKDLANKIKGKAADNTFVGATLAAPGSKGLVPEPQAGDNAKFLSGDGTWQTSPTVNNGALTIQQNGTALDTFTANSSDDKTVNIQTITAETVAPAEEVGAIATNMIADGAVTSAKVDWSTLLPSNFSALESASQNWTVFSIGRLKFIWKQITQSSNGWKDFGQIPDECVGSSMIMFQWTSLYGNNATGYSAAAQLSGGHIFAQVQGINNSNGGWAFAVFA